MKTGAVAAGHPATAEAAAEILAEGGNAVDAALGGLAAACVAEPILASLGGGGFLMAWPAGGQPVLHDFFTQTPKNFRRPDETDFRAITADFGTATQEFHVGLGAVATPGVTAGLFAAHVAHGRLPIARIFAPAVRLARAGVAVNPLQDYIRAIVAPIYADLPVYHGPRVVLPELADTFEALAAEGPALFYRGEIGARLVDLCRAGGGHLERADLADYRVEPRQPIAIDHGGARLWFNPPPSFGGTLIAFGLELLSGADLGPWGSETHLLALARAMVLTQQARAEADPLAPDRLAVYRRELAGVPRVSRGTTQISVIDAAGNVAALTVSNGEGTGRFIPGTGIMLNNMLGEDDINPQGFFNWPRDRRMGSMMAPTLMREADGGLAAFGSGGSNRIRTALLQAALNRLVFGLAWGEAVEYPRLHMEGEFLNLEDGFPPQAAARLRVEYPAHRRWEGRNLFFGGVHVAARDGAGRFVAAGDPRRGGEGLVV